MIDFESEKIRVKLISDILWQEIGLLIKEKP